MMIEPTNTKSGHKGSDTLVDSLRESDDFTRSKIIEQLVFSPNKSMIEEVIHLLDEKNTSVRMDILELLKKTGNHNIDAVIQLLYHPNEDIRVYGCEVLSYLKNKASLPHLIQKVNEDSENVKNAAVVALGEFDDQKAINVLLEVLEQEEWVAFSAIYSLAKMGNKKVVPALLDVFKNREEELSLAACETLISFRDDKIIDDIVDFVGRLEEDKKNIFVRVIIEQSDDAIFLKLHDQMNDELLSHVLSYMKIQKRKALGVAKFLVHFKNKLSVQAMLDILKDLDQDSEDFERVMRLLMELHDVWEGHLEEYLGVEEYRLPLIRACGNLCCFIDESILLKVFCVSSLDTKREIMKQLCRIINGSGHKIIREAMNDTDGHVQADAVAIAGTLLLTELTSDVMIIAKNSYPDVRGKALLALLRLDSKMAMAAIDWFVQEGSSEDKRVYLSVASHIDMEINYSFLRQLITDSDDRIRQMAIRIIGNSLENEQYLDLFELVLESGSIPIEVLKLVGEKKLIGFKKLLIDLVLDPLQAVWTRYHAFIALGAFGDKSLFPIFLNALKEKENLIKIGGLKALAELRDTRAIPRIRPYTKSTDEDVKTAAMMALGKLSRSEAVC
jgi:HEAT repeat protein